MNAFIVVGNIRKFDIVDHFKKCNTVIWKQVSKCEIGDEVYVYVGQPLSRLIYKCRITRKNVDIEGIGYLSSLIGTRKKSFMELELIQELASGDLGLKALMKNGLKTVQCSTMANNDLRAYIDEVTK